MNFTAIEKRLPVLSLAGFALGLTVAKFLPDFSRFFFDSVTRFVDAYRLVAPVVLYCVLAVSLARFRQSGKNSGMRFAVRAVLWLLLARILALLFAVVFTGLVFRLPMVLVEQGSKSLSVVERLARMISAVGMALRGPYFLAAGLALVTGLLSKKWRRVESVLNACANAIEVWGGAFAILIPFFLFAMGSYVACVSQNLEVLGGRGGVAMCGKVTILVFSMDVYQTAGIFWIYLAGSLLTGIACLLWHTGLLACCKIFRKGFSLSCYVRDYWLGVYPLLWATASESLATPLNLHLIKKVYPEISTEIRRFVIGVGSYLNVNGTMLCAVILAALVAGLLGIPLSWGRLLLCLPMIFVIGFAVPGIPGELLLFAGPLAWVLHVPASSWNSFVTLYIALQFGLPDSFRTGNNSTDSCALALLINRMYIPGKPVQNRPAHGNNFPA